MTCCFRSSFARQGLSSYRTVIAKAVAKAEVVDDRTIKFIFQPKYPRRDVIQTVGSQIVFRARISARTNAISNSPATSPLSARALYVRQRRDGPLRQLQAQSRLLGQGSGSERRAAQFRQDPHQYFGDYESAFEAFKAGVIYLSQRGVVDHLGDALRFPSFKSGAVKRETLPRTAISPAGQSWVFNLRRPQFQDIRVREAIGLMFNFEWSNETLFYQLYSRTESFWDNSPLDGDWKALDAERAAGTAGQDLRAGVLTDDAVLQPVSARRS